ncbi:tRNA (N6-isopentenyl adenosine(37)-C2)-methylthiotransferase MiaB [Blattabacterium cuenoti]|uniref:tRNA (N6-isopentenyl adenosine(37)-C2)-methylthiotransferase MiaB n=1 Tax=Blattabacterium cuenoti TaxID=1653831 RepID=UPI00163D113B|nr:tRNA (N6-isopentenyl adenosine(37)-C2)-methylthiotransferase MiaB [Blattabacterium cuenoti]
MEKNQKKLNKSFYIETYGCQMNVADSEIVTSILCNDGFFLSEYLEEANIILFNSCSVREKAELTLKKRLEQLQFVKKKKKILFGVIGCLSKKVRDLLLKEKKIDFFVNQNSYKELSNFIRYASIGKKYLYFNPQVNHQKKETYADISPFIKKKKITTFLSITRGCDNMCTFCIVPFTRGREISSNPYYIIDECKRLYKNGYKEITLLGQNVDSYKWNKGLITIDFSDLLSLLAIEIPLMRIRFSTSNPHDMSDKVLKIISKHSNICKHIHLPVQSGSNKILKLMNRKYTREKYLSLVKKIRTIIPECSISHDIMTGFCNEEEKDHQDTIDLMNQIQYNYGYMFSYSPRPGTYAYRKLEDNVPKNVKKERLKEIIDLQKKHSLFRLKEYLGKVQEVLIEGESKRNNQYWYGRNTQNLVVVFPKESYKMGNIVSVKITDSTSATLIGKIYKKTWNLSKI